MKEGKKKIKLEEQSCIRMCLIANCKYAWWQRSAYCSSKYSCNQNVVILPSEQGLTPPQGCRQPLPHMK